MLAELRAIVGENNVLTEDDDTAGYLVDWSNRFFGKTPAVVRPGNTEEVAQVLALANRTAIACSSARKLVSSINLPSRRFIIVSS